MSLLIDTKMYIIRITHMTLTHTNADQSSQGCPDDRLSLKEVCSLLPSRNGKKPCLLTVWRWVTKGVAVTNGRVRLRAFRVGRNWFTRSAWVDEFISALSEGADRNVVTDGCGMDGNRPIDNQRRQRLAEARQRLAARGLRSAQKKK